MDPSPFTDPEVGRMIGQVACHILKLIGAGIIFLGFLFFFRSLGQVDGPEVRKRPRLPDSKPGGPVNARKQPLSGVPPLGGRTRTH